jgi:hypothetical protein
MEVETRERQTKPRRATPATHHRDAIQMAVDARGAAERFMMVRIPCQPYWQVAAFVKTTHDIDEIDCYHCLRCLAKRARERTAG